MENHKYVFLNLHFFVLQYTFQNPKTTCLFPGFGSQMVSYFFPLLRFYTLYYHKLNYVLYTMSCAQPIEVYLSICNLSLFIYAMLGYYNSHVLQHNKEKSNLIKYLCCRK